MVKTNTDIMGSVNIHAAEPGYKPGLYLKALSIDPGKPKHPRNLICHTSDGHVDEIPLLSYGFGSDSLDISSTGDEVIKSVVQDPEYNFTKVTLLFGGMAGQNVYSFNWDKERWDVTEGDTGWRRIGTSIPYCTYARGIDVRRVNNRVMIRFEPVDYNGIGSTQIVTKSNTNVTLPPGFQLFSRKTFAIYHDDGPCGYVLIRNNQIYVTWTKIVARFASFHAEWHIEDERPETLPGTEIESDY